MCYILTARYTLVEMWECDFRSLIKTDPDLRKFMEDYELVEPLHARDAFFGGRTNGYVMHYECQPDEEIKVLDFTSLYPWVRIVCNI